MRTELKTERGRFQAHIRLVNVSNPRPSSLIGWLKYLWAQDNVQILVVVAFLMFAACLGR